MPRVLLMAIILMLESSVHAQTLRQDLEVVAHARVYFGHQSVGANILDGLKELSASAGVPVQIAELPHAADLHSPGVGHTFVAENGDPLRKLQSFAAALGEGSQADVAFLKFCYVDVNAETDARALFDAYRKMIDGLRAKNPRTTFVHVTLPLTTVQTGPKAWAKRILGRAPSGTIQNVKREEYNSLLRRTYSGREPIFDLARLESIGADGSEASVEWGGTRAPAMQFAYTEDGGHLNRAGRLRAAQGLVRVLAAARRPLQKIEDSATPVRLSR